MDQQNTKKQWYEVAKNLILIVLGIFLNHSSYLNGEVLLFRAKKSRYRAIPVMSNIDGQSMTSKFTFESSLTFKEWLKRVYSNEKGEQMIWQKNFKFYDFFVYPFTQIGHIQILIAQQSANCSFVF